MLHTVSENSLTFCVEAAAGTVPCLGTVKLDSPL